MSYRPLPRTAPGAAGVEAAGIDALLDAVEAAPDIELHSLMVLRHGLVVAEGWWEPYSAERVHLLYSLSKSFTSTAAGLAVGEGLMDLDDPVLKFFPELDGDITDPRSRSLLVRHVAAMASGHLEETLEQADALDPHDLVRGFLLIPPDEEPGSVFAYNQPCTFTLGAIVQRVSGESLTDFLRPRLFDPLGIGEVGWVRDGSGREIGWSGLHVTTEAVAKLGLLYLQGGRWADGQLLAGEWVAEATRLQIHTPPDRDPDWRQGYGFQFWMSRHGYRGDGAYGQFCLVLPDFDVVLAITAQTVNMQGVLDLVWEHLLPACKAEMTTGSSAGGPDIELAQRLGSLRLPPVQGGAIPVGNSSQRFTAAAGNDQPGLTEVLLQSGEDGGWSITLVEGNSPITADLGIGDWLTTGPIATSSGWLEPTHHGETGSLHIDVVFVETPHRLHLICRPSTGTVESRWVTAPLQTVRLIDLRMPRLMAAP